MQIEGAKQEGVFNEKLKILQFPEVLLMILHWLPVMLTQIESERRDDRKQDNTDQNSFFFFYTTGFQKLGLISGG